MNWTWWWKPRGPLGGKLSGAEMRELERQRGTSDQGVRRRHDQGPRGRAGDARTFAGQGQAGARPAAKGLTPCNRYSATAPTRDRFLRENIEAVYHTLTDGLTRFVRVEDLVRCAAEAYPGLVPTQEQLAARRRAGR